MKHINYFRLNIDSNIPSSYVAIEVKQIAVAAMNNVRLVVGNTEFTKVTLDKGVAFEYYELSKPSHLTWSIGSGDHMDKMLVEMYCHYQSRADFIRYCNEILAANEGYNNYYVNSLGDVIKINQTEDML